MGKYSITEIAESLSVSRPNRLSHSHPPPFPSAYDPAPYRNRPQLACFKLLIIDELGFVPLSSTGAELLFKIFYQRYERGSVLVTTNLPFDEWTGVSGWEIDRGAAGPAYPPRSPPGDERRQGSREDAEPQSPDCSDDARLVPERLPLTPGHCPRRDISHE